MKIKLNILFIFLMVASSGLLSQSENKESDSLNLMKLINKCDANSRDEILFRSLITKAIVDAKKINSTYGLGRLNLSMGMFHYSNGNYDSSNYYNFKAKEILSRTSYHKIKGACLLGIASNYVALHNYKEGTKIMLEYIDYVKKNNIVVMEVYGYEKLSKLNSLNNNEEEAIKNLNQALILANKNKFENRVAAILDLKSMSFLALAKRIENRDKKQSFLDSSFVNSQKSLLISETRKDSIELPVVLNNSALIYEVKGEYELMYKNAMRALLIEKGRRNLDGYALSYTSLAKADAFLNRYDEAKLFLDSSFFYAKKYDDIEDLNLFYDAGIIVSKQINDCTTAYDFLLLKNTLNDSLLNVDSKNKINELEIKFDTNNKEKTILLQNEKLKQRSNLIIFISLIAFLIGIISYLLFSRFKNKKNKQLIEQENEASLKIIQSEQTERMRIARELHDGIGQKLTVLKMYASVNEIENKKQIDLLDSTISEVRGISHNLMPEIINLGLVPAVKDLCSKINEVGTIQCVFNYEETQPLKFATNIELSIYRIVQEVFNNMIKHANAKQILVSFVVTGNNLRINIADDGVGFDTQKIYTSSGIGWSNIITRAKIINANLDVNSNSKGTNIVLNINI